MSKLEKVLLSKGIKIETTDGLTQVPVKAWLIELDQDVLVLVFQNTLNRQLRQKVICDVLRFLKEGTLFSEMVCEIKESIIWLVWKYFYVKGGQVA